jgi:alpha-glucoside transport system substrate-binding protein
MKRTLKGTAAVLAAAFLITACGGGDESSDTEATEDTAAEESTESDEAAATSLLDGEIPCEQQYAGKSVTIFSPVRDSDNDTPIADYVAGYDPLVECTGVEIVWEGTDQFETEINVRLEGGNAPDVIDYPQPGLMAGHARKGYLVEFPADVAAHTQNDFIAGWDSYSTIDSKVYGIPGRSNIKSLVWYSPKAFADKGYAIPESLDDLKALSDKIVADGGTPWCVGAESGVATGWVLTDWMEDMMLRTHGETVYDQWVSHEMAFNDPKVAQVADAVGAYVKNADYLGGADLVKAIATTKFQDGGLPILDGNCYMHRQASFYAGLWPQGTTVGEDGDVNVFYLPSPAGGPKYMLGAGDIYAAGTDKPETFDVLRYTGSVAYQTHLVQTRKELSPNKALDTAIIADPFTKKLSELQKGADVFRFDASDLMPGSVGAGTFWTEVTKWVIGGSTKDFVDNVEASWPKS